MDEMFSDAEAEVIEQPTMTMTRAEAVPLARTLLAVTERAGTIDLDKPTTTMTRAEAVTLARALLAIAQE